MASSVSSASRLSPAAREHHVAIDLDAGLGWKYGSSIGQGAYGSVYKALHRETGRIFAVKKGDLGCYKSPNGEDQKFIDTLQNELQICMRLRHPRIVSYLGHSMTREHLLIYLEFIAGGSVLARLQEFGAFEEPVLRSCAQDLLEGLHYLHSQKPPVVHRDVKCANVLIDLDSRIKLTDFGCSKRSDVTISNTVVGSAPWMAPEVVHGKLRGRKSDIWSFGCTLVEMATAEAPWGTNAFENIFAFVRRIASPDAMPPLPEDACPAALDLIRRCLRRESEERPTARELLKDDFFRVKAS